MHTSSLTALGSLLLTPALLAQNPLGLETIVDLDPTVESLSSDPSPGRASSRSGDFPVIGSFAYFAATTATGRELWRCQTTAGSAELVADIQPGAGGSEPESLVVVGNELYFTADDGVHGRELWKTDGTASGTMMVADLNVGAGSSFIRFPTAFGSALIFAVDAGLGRELYITDGTANGTQIIADIIPGSVGSNPQPLGVTPSGHLLFSANDGVNGTEPWITDGTAVGTRLLQDLSPGAPSSEVALGSRLQVFGSHLYYGAIVSSQQPALCRTDGTTNEIVKLFPQTQFLFSPSAFAVFQGQLWLTAGQDVTGTEIYTSDGTDAGTQLFADLNPNGSVFIREALVSADGAGLYLNLNSDLVVLDGTPTGIVTVPGADPTEMVNYGGAVLCQAEVDSNIGSELYSIASNGALTLITELQSGPNGDGPSSLTVLGNVVVCSGQQLPVGREVFVTDGTAIGTGLLEDVETRTTTARVFGGEFASAGSRTFFGASDNSNGEELWVTDGTATGTRLVEDVNPGPSDAYPYNFAAIGDRVLFNANDGIHGEELWVSDGTAAGTFLVADIQPGSAGSEPGEIAVLDGIAYFTADDGTNGFELWRSDGTAAGTFLVADINGSGDSDIDELTTAGRLVFFEADEGVSGREVWCTDGTAAGTRLVGDIATGPADSRPRDFVATRDGVLFLATGPSGNQSLWSSDGQSITEVVSSADVGGGRVDYFARTDGGRIYLTAELNRTDDLWVLDGGVLSQLTVLPNRTSLLYLRACGERGVTRDRGTDSLIVSGGSVATTAAVAGVVGSIDEGHILGETLFFEGRQNDGSELWATDGTVAGTRRVVDLFAGSNGSNRGPIFPIGGDLGFLADTFSEKGVLYALRHPGANVLPEGITCGAPDQGLRVEPAIIGQPMRIDAAGNPGSASVLIAADFPDQGFSAFGCDFYFNVTGILLASAAGPDLVFDLPVPNDVGLLDAALVFQAVWVDSALQLETSKGMRTTIDDK